MKSNKKKQDKERPNQAGQNPDPNEWIRKLERAEGQARIGSWEFDVATGQGWWSRQMYAFFGSDGSGGVPDIETYLSYLHPQDRPILQAALDAMAQGTEPDKRDFRTNPERGAMRVLRPNYQLERDENGQPLRFSGTLQDITEQVQAEENLRKNEERFRSTFDSMLEGAQIIGFDWRYLYVNAAAERHNRRPSSELLGNVYMEMWPGIESTHVFSVVRRCMEERTPALLENEFTFPDGAVGWFELSIQPVPEGVFILSIDISERKRAERNLARMMRLYATLSQVNQTIIRAQERTELFQSICKAAATFGGLSLVWVGLLDEATGDIRPVAANSLEVDQWPFPIVNIHAGAFVDGLVATAVRTSRVVVTDNLQNDERVQPLQGLFQEHGYFASAAIPFRSRGRTIGVIGLASHETGLFKTGEELHLLEEMGMDISFALDKLADDEERRQAVRALEHNERILRLFVEHSPAAIAMLDRDMRYIITSRRYLADYGLGEQDLTGRSHYEVFPEIPERWREIHRRCLAGAIEKADDDPFPRADGRLDWVHWEIHPWYEEEGEIGGIILFSEVVTERRQAEIEVQKQLKRLKALNEIDRAINSVLDLRMALEILLNKVLSQLNVDAAAILLLDSAGQSLEFIAGKGFRSQAIRKSQIELGHGLVGKAGRERKVLHVQNLAESGGRFERAELLKDEAFVEYFGVPLIAKGTLKGVLEIFNRTPLATDGDWVHYMETLGGQAAIAIDNAQLFQGVQRSNTELIIAYDATIAGWSRAMDLRDKETEGHTQRVTELTLRLAGKMGISQPEMVQIRRGALLHDIGKLGVPDHILLKPGKLTDEEWVMMRQHPVYALDMLRPIQYLQAALDIPYCHHEKWDGSGYPRKLSGEQIPLAARIFAVIDVWDALRSDRPYRESWSAPKTRDYIQAESGRHFDPQVVNAFLTMLEESPNLN